jgi:cholesterol transport system auxiliary component
MNIIKILMLLTAFIGLTGCFSTSKNYYVLSVASTPSVVFPINRKVIGVEKVTVPGYLYKRDIAIAKSENEITLLGNALWGEDLDSGLTNRVIDFLQRKFNQPNIFAYPWGIDKQPNLKVSIQITRFIAQGNNVYLDATWRIENLKTKRRKAKLFKTTVPTTANIKDIVASMNKAFMEFEETVAQGIRNF